MDQVKFYQSLCMPVSYNELAQLKYSLGAGSYSAVALLPSNQQMQQISNALTARAEKGCP